MSYSLAHYIVQLDCCILSKALRNICLQVHNGNKKLRGNERIPLAEQMRPTSLLNFVGQKHILGPRTMLSELLQKGEIPNMILWGPPGCGKVVIASDSNYLCMQMHARVLIYLFLFFFLRRLWPTSSRTGVRTTRATSYATLSSPRR